MQSQEKIENIQLPEFLPERAFLQRSINDLDSGGVPDDREDLPKVSSEEKDFPPKRSRDSRQVSEGTVQCFHDVPVHHWSLIPDDDEGFLDELKHICATSQCNASKKM